MRTNRIVKQNWIKIRIFYCVLFVKTFTELCTCYCIFVTLTLINCTCPSFYMDSSIYYCSGINCSMTDLIANSADHDQITWMCLLIIVCPGGKGINSSWHRVRVNLSIVLYVLHESVISLFSSQVVTLCPCYHQLLLSS